MTATATTLPLVPVLAPTFPLPQGTDFSTWNRATLEKFAADCSTELCITQADLKTAMKGYRQLITEIDNLSNIRPL
jgi:hypothetical protein